MIRSTFWHQKYCSRCESYQEYCGECSASTEGTKLIQSRGGRYCIVTEEQMYEIIKYEDELEELEKVPEDSKLFKTRKPTTLCVDKKCTNYSEKSIFYCIICT